METILPILFLILIINAVVSSARKFFSNVLEGIEQASLEAGHAPKDLTYDGSGDEGGLAGRGYPSSQNSGESDHSSGGRDGNSSRGGFQKGSLGSAANGLAEIMKRRISSGKKKGRSGPATWWNSRPNDDIARQSEGDADRAIALITANGPEGITKTALWLKANQPSSSTLPEERDFIDALNMRLGDLVTKNRKSSEAVQDKKDELARGVARRGKAGPLADMLQNRSSIKNAVIISEILKRKI